MENLLSKICKNSLFENIDTQKLQDFIPKKPSKFLKEGEVIFSKGQPAKTIYLVLSGNVNRIDYNFVDKSRSKENNEVISEDGFFGYEEISSHTTRTSTTITLTHSEIFELTTDELDIIIRKNIRILENLTKSVLDTKKRRRTPQSDSDSENSKATKIPSFSFKGKVQDNMIKSNRKIEIKNTDDVSKLAESLQKEKEFAEKAISDEMEAISKKEEELSKLEESLAKEKKFAEQELSKEFNDLDAKEKRIAELEKSIEKQKEKTEKFIAQKLKEISQKESELKKKASSFDQDKKLLDEALNKTKLIADKEMELLKRAKALEKEKEHIEKVKSKEEELRKKEEKIEQMLREIEEERSIIEISKSKEKDLKQKEKELDNKFKKLSSEEKITSEYQLKEEELKRKEEELKRMSAALENEKLFAEKTLQSEIEEIKRKEEELKQKEENLKREKELSEQTLQKELEELEKREQQLSTPPPIDDHDSEIESYQDQIVKLKEKEKELLNRIKELEEKKLEEDKAKENVDKVKPEIEPSEFQDKSEKEEQPDFNEFENEPDEDESFQKEEKENDFQHFKPSKTIIEEDNSHFVSFAISGSETSIVKRDFQQLFQQIEHDDIKIILVNVQRGTANFSAAFRTMLEDAIKDGYRKVIIDITYSDYLDSTFLGVMVRFLKKLSIEGGHLKVILDVTKMTSSTFFLSGMDRVFTIHDNINSAIKEFYK